MQSKRTKKERKKDNKEAVWDKSNLNWQWVPTLAVKPGLRSTWKCVYASSYYLPTTATIRLGSQQTNAFTASRASPRSSVVSSIDCLQVFIHNRNCLKPCLSLLALFGKFLSAPKSLSCLSFNIYLISFALFQTKKKKKTALVIFSLD